MTTIIEHSQFVQPEDLSKGFGPHLMMDCKGVNYDKCSDVGFVWQFLNDLPDKIGMTKITQPYVFPYSGLVPEDKGVTGVVIIAESHLTFHSFTEKDYFFFDCFSCKPFDVDKMMHEVLNAFDVKTVDIHKAFRGLEFPRSEVHEAGNNSQTATITAASFIDANNNSASHRYANKPLSIV